MKETSRLTLLFQKIWWVMACRALYNKSSNLYNELIWSDMNILSPVTQRVEPTHLSSRIINVTSFITRAYLDFMSIMH